MVPCIEHLAKTGHSTTDHMANFDFDSAKKTETV